MRIATMTWFHYKNYGTVLQAVALTYKLRNLGHEATMINYKSPGYHRTIPDYSFGSLSKKVKRKLSDTKQNQNVSTFTSEEKSKLFKEFLSKNLTFTDPCITKSDLENLNLYYDAFICGSDQIWSPLFFNPRYFLDFVSDTSKKISYAPSIGTDTIDDKYIKSQMKDLFSQIGTLSVREYAGARIIKELTGRNAEVVADPTLLLTKNEWMTLCKECSSILTDQPYILVYFLGSNNENWASVQAISEKLGIGLKIIPVFEQDVQRNGCCKEAIGPEQFLQLFLNASYVCTDSFHGMVFSILFHRNFAAFERFQSNDPSNQNSRVYNLLDTLQLRTRLVHNHTDIVRVLQDIKYSDTDALLEELRKKSISYLESALRTAGKSSSSVIHPVTLQNSLCCGCGACEAVCPKGAVKVSVNDKGFLTASLDESRCIHCNRCTKVCPFCNDVHSTKAENAALYSFKSNDSDLLARSTSGGAAATISQFLLDQGYSIAGCHYNIKTQRAEHILLSEPNELYMLQGSKYIQSSFQSVLNEIANTNSPTVIFGTPCQIAAAKKVFSKRDNIIYIDLVCHGVPTYFLYQRYRNYIAQMSGIDKTRMQMVFRYKPKGWRNIYLYATDGNHEYCCSKEADPFFRMFEVGNCYNECCYDCRWRADSEADIRLADYWGPKFEGDNTGVSMMIAFTERGKNILNDISSVGCGYMQEQPIFDYLEYQQSLNLPKPVFYDQLINTLATNEKDLNSIVQKYAIPLENGQMSKIDHIKYIVRMIVDKEN